MHEQQFVFGSHPQIFLCKRGQEACWFKSKYGFFLRCSLLGGVDFNTFVKHGVSCQSWQSYMLTVKQCEQISNRTNCDSRV